MLVLVFVLVVSGGVFRGGGCGARRRLNVRGFCTATPVDRGVFLQGQG